MCMFCIAPNANYKNNIKNNINNKDNINIKYRYKNKEVREIG